MAENFINNFIVDTNLFTSYNYKRIRVDENVAVKGFPHIFFTTPMLNLTLKNVNSDSFLTYMAYAHKEWLDCLSYGGNDANKYSTTSPFMTLLYNTATNFDTKDAVSRTKEVGETYYGFKETLPGPDVESIVGDELTINFLDLHGLPVLHILNSWFIYHNKIRRGQLSPSLDAIRAPYIDYVSSVYYFLTDMDNSSLLYWAKYTGVAPISVPFSQFSSDYSSHDIIKYPVNFVYSFKEDMNPEILTDFNKVAKGYASSINYNANNNDKADYMQSAAMKIKESEADLYNEQYLTNYNRTRPEIVVGTFVNNSDGMLRNQQVKFKLMFNGQ